MKTSDFNYHLPPELIAQEPLPERSDSRMMVLHRDDGRIEHKHIKNISNFLKPGDLMVLNNTRVIPSRIFGHREDTGGRVELLLVEEEKTISNNQQPITNEEIWNCFYKASGRPRVGMNLMLANEKLRGEIVKVLDEGRILLKLTGDKSLFDILDEEGVAPLPPYIKRHSTFDVQHSAISHSLDKERYQTVYARTPGAVAAPTAGLHFTPELLVELEKHGVKRTEITLHVGPGTFKPVSAEDVQDHVMENERYQIGQESAAVINDARKTGGRVMAVGSTTVRLLETVAAEYDSIVSTMGRTSIFIYPPYKFKTIDVLLTNFHLPMSSLIMMVSAFAGKDMVLNAYNEAIKEKYRFYSYGDCMLIL